MRQQYEMYDIPSGLQLKKIAVYSIITRTNLTHVKHVWRVTYAKPFVYRWEESKLCFWSIDGNQYTNASANCMLKASMKLKI